MQMRWYTYYANHVLQVECEFKETSKHSSSLKKVSDSGYSVSKQEPIQKKMKTLSSRNHWA